MKVSILTSAAAPQISFYFDKRELYEIMFPDKKEGETLRVNVFGNVRDGFRFRPDSAGMYKITAGNLKLSCKKVGASLSRQWLKQIPRKIDGRTITTGALPQEFWAVPPKKPIMTFGSTVRTIARGPAKTEIPVLAPRPEPSTPMTPIQHHLLRIARDMGELVTEEDMVSREAAAKFLAPWLANLDNKDEVVAKAQMAVERETAPEIKRPTVVKSYKGDVDISNLLAAKECYNEVNHSINELDKQIEMLTALRDQKARELVEALKMINEEVETIRKKGDVSVKMEENDDGEMVITISYLESMTI